MQHANSREKNSRLLTWLARGRTFAAGGLLSAAVVSVIFDLMSKPLPDSAATWAVTVGGAVVVIAEKLVDLATA